MARRPSTTTTTTTTTTKPLVLLLLLLLILLSVMVADAFILPVPAANRFPLTIRSSSAAATTRLQATASFLPGDDEEGSSGNGPLASVPTLDSLEALQRAAQATGDKPLVVRFHASWCSACKKFAPLWLQTAGAYAGEGGNGFDFVDVDVTNQRDIITAMGLTVLPHCHIYMHGQRAESLPVSVKKLNNLLETLERLKGSSPSASS